jgi:cobalt/nickel transport protein
MAKQQAEACYGTGTLNNINIAATKVLYQEGTKIQWLFLCKNQELHMKKTTIMLFAAGLISVIYLSGQAQAHFGMIIPSDSMVGQRDDKILRLTLSFSHPFESIGMEMVKPRAFRAVVAGKSQDLMGSLQPTRLMGQSAWTALFPIKRPGLVVFYMEPEPYWEPAEDAFIIHYTKTVVTAFGDEEGWDREIGLKTEIVPLAKPYGLYAGNVFQGIVKIDGAPAAYAEVEVEHYNRGGRASAPSEYMITQTIKADQNGVFTYGVPKAGWWGFAALSQADFKLQHNGVDKDVEIGAVIWVEFHDWQ